MPAELPEQSGLEAELTLQDTALWFPDIPHPDLEILGVPEIRGGLKGLPLSVAVFGGLRGQDLKHLLSLTLVLDYNSGGPLAVEVAYSDGRTLVCFGVFNPNDSVERITFPVDGHGGERITSVEAVYSKQHAFYGFGVRIFRSPIT